MGNDNAGHVDILNTKLGHDDKTIDFKANPENARIIVKDMLKRGYFLTVNIDGEDVKVTAFDDKHDVYIIKDVPESLKGKADEKGQLSVPAAETKATAIAPTAGG